jgi:hypothetical protein
MAAGGPRWPQTRLAVVSWRKRVALPLDQFSQSFGHDFDAWREQLASDALSPPHGMGRVYAPITIRATAQRMLRFASIVVRAGIPASKLTSLAAVVRPDLAKASRRCGARAAEGVRERSTRWGAP